MEYVEIEEIEDLNKEEVAQVESLDKELSEIKEEMTSEDNISEQVIDKIEEKMSDETAEFADLSSDSYNISHSAIDKVDPTTNMSSEFIEEAEESLDRNVEPQEYTISKDSDTNEFVATDFNDNEIARDTDLESVLNDVKEDFSNDLEKQVEDILDKVTDELAQDFDRSAAEVKDMEFTTERISNMSIGGEINEKREDYIVENGNADQQLALLDRDSEYEEVTSAYKEEISEKLQNSDYEEVREAVAKTTKNEEILDNLSNDESESVREAVANNENTSEETLDKLANDDWGNDIKDSINEGLSQAAENAQDNSQIQEASNDSGMER